MKKLKYLAIALFAFSGIQQNAHAFGLMAAFTDSHNIYKNIDGSRYDWDGWDVFWCTFTLPFCALDEKADAAASLSVKTVSYKDLVASEYTASDILKDQSVLVQYAVRHEGKVAFTDGDTVESVQAFLNDVSKEVGHRFSDEYARFLVQYRF